MPTEAYRVGMSATPQPPTFAAYLKTLDGRRLEIFVVGKEKAVADEGTVEAHDDYFTTGSGRNVIPFAHIVRVRIAD